MYQIRNHPNRMNTVPLNRLQLGSERRGRGRNLLRGVQRFLNRVEQISSRIGTLSIEEDCQIVDSFRELRVRSKKTDQHVLSCLFYFLCLLPLRHSHQLPKLYNNHPRVSLPFPYSTLRLLTKYRTRDRTRCELLHHRNIDACELRRLRERGNGTGENISDMNRGRLLAEVRVEREEEDCSRWEVVRLELEALELVRLV